MDRAFAGGAGWRWLYLSDLFYRAGFFHRSRRLARRCGTRHLHARYLGVSLGACRHGLLLLLRAVDLLRRALSIAAQGESLRSSLCLRFYSARHIDQRAYWNRSAGADIRRAHARAKGLAHDRRCQVAARNPDFFADWRAVVLSR